MKEEEVKQESEKKTKCHSCIFHLTGECEFAFKSPGCITYIPNAGELIDVDIDDEY